MENVGAVDAGESPLSMKDQLGHSSIKMTVDIYGHRIPDANRRAVNQLPGLQNPAPNTVKQRLGAD